MPVESPRRMLILDFDGVLVDSEPLHAESWQRAFGEAFGAPADDGPFEIGLGLEAIFARRSAALGITLSPEEQEAILARKTQIFYTLGAEALRPLPGSVDLIRRARALGWYVGIVSRARRLRLHGTLEIMRMPVFFDVVLGCEDGVDPLTDRKDHARAGRFFGIDPAHCLVIEDSTTGVADARACGIGRVVGYTSSLPAQALCAAGAHAVVAHLDDVELAP